MRNNHAREHLSLFAQSHVNIVAASAKLQRCWTSVNRPIGREYSKWKMYKSICNVFHKEFSKEAYLPFSCLQRCFEP